MKKYLYRLSCRKGLKTSEGVVWEKDMKSAEWHVQYLANHMRMRIVGIYLDGEEPKEI